MVCPCGWLTWGKEISEISESENDKNQALDTPHHIQTSILEIKDKRPKEATKIGSSNLPRLCLLISQSGV